MDLRREGPGSSHPPAPPLPAASACADLPVDLEENRGQADPGARFIVRARGFLAFLTDEGAVIACAAGKGPDRHAPPDAPAPVFRPDVVRLRFPGADPLSPHRGLAPRPGVSNYLRGGDPSRWVTGVPRFGEVLRRDLWPGIDLRWRGGAGRSLEYSFVLRPGADPARIAIAFEGAAARVAPDGDLLLATARGTLRNRRPFAFQERDGLRVPVAASFAPRPGGTVGFAVGAFDPESPLVLDPELVFFATQGGSGVDEAWAVASDPAGDVYIAGWAVSTDMPVKGAFQVANAGGSFSAFVAKRGVRGSGLVYATYLGGSTSELAYGLAVDAAGSAHVVGGSFSADFPVTASAFQQSRANAAETGFVAKLAPSGAALSWSTFLGGTVRETVQGIALGAGGAVYLVGSTSSPDFPAVAAAQAAAGGASDAFVSRMASDGGSLAWSTFLGGSLIDEGRAIGLGTDGTVFVAGSTESPDFPDVSALQTTLSGVRDAFAAALAPDGSSFAWATYLGGAGQEEAWGLAVDASGSPWVVGYTTSTDFPLQSPVDSVFEGQFEAFATKFAADGSARLVSTYLGGKGDDKAEAAAADGAGVVYVVGRTDSTGFPTVSPIQPTFRGGEFDAFVTALAPSGTQILWSTYYGGKGTDYAMAVTVDPFNAALFAGRLEGTSADGLAAEIIAVPVPPPAFTATLTGLARVRLDWLNQGKSADGTILQRRTGAGPWEDVATTASGIHRWIDLGLAYSTTYTWRAISFNAYGRSAPSAEATVTTLAYPTSPPAMPADFRMYSFDARRADTTWEDVSDNEDGFVLERFEPGIGFLPLANLDMNTRYYSDTAVLPLRDYRYRLRAVNPLGSSPTTPEATVSLPQSFGVTLLAGKRRARTPAAKDTLVLSGTAQRLGATRWSTLDPTGVVVEAWIGTDARPLLSIPAGYAGWKSRKGLWVLKYPHYPRGNLLLVLDPVGRTFKLTMSKADLPDFAGGPEAVKLLFGDDGAAFDVPWVPARKAGDYRLP
jgi:hypothetical protein